MATLETKQNNSRRKARKTMIKYIGATQPLPHDCYVHHKDRNPFNNNISNLQITGAGEHARLHRKTEKRLKIKKELESLESLLTWYNVEIAA